MKPLRYGPLAQLSDWYHGHRDGRAGIPARPEKPGHRVSTPHRDTLIASAQGAFEQEKLWYERHRADIMKRREAAAARRDTHTEQRAWAESELARVSVAPTQAELTRRRHREDRRSNQVVVARRIGEHRKQVERARLVVQQAARALAQAEAEVADAEEEATRLRAAAHARVGRVHEHYHRRLAAYRRVLIKVHRDGAWANSALDPRDPVLPPWAGTPGGGHTPVPEPDRPEPHPTPPSDEPVPVRIMPLTEFTTFGHDPGASDHVITGPTVAPRHFTLTRSGEGHVLRDLGFGHGPYVGGELVRNALLLPGQGFDFADHRYVITEDGTGLAEFPLKAILIVAGLGARNADGQVRLTEMSFEQKEKTVLAVLGPSGAGKSSLFAALLGELEPDTGGQVFFDGQDLRNHSAQIRDELGYVPQANDADLHLTLTVRRLLRYSFRLRSGLERKQIDKRIEEVCASLDLEDKLDRPATALSGGQRRRVSIAVELLTEPRLLMLDEPTSGLDPGLDLEVMKILGDYARGDKTVIVITHATEHLSEAQQALVVVGFGRPVYSGPPDGVVATLGWDSWAELMQGLKDEEHAARAFAAYASGPRADEAKEAAARARLKPSPDAERKRKRSPALDFPRQLRWIALRQLALLWARGASRRKSKLDRLLPQWPKTVLRVLTPLLLAGALGLVAGWVCGGDALSGPGAHDGKTAVSLLTTLCMLSGQALTYSDIVSEFPILRREHRTGALTLAVMLAKWAVFALAAAGEAAVAALCFVWAGPYPGYGLYLGALPDLMIALATLTVTAMSLGMLISVLGGKKLELAVAFVSAVSIAQITFNGVTHDVSGRLHWVAAVFPLRWGVSAIAASTGVAMPPARPGAPAGVPVPKPKDGTWNHTIAQWSHDLGWLVGLSIVFFLLATYLLRRRLNAPDKG